MSLINACKENNDLAIKILSLTQQDTVNDTCEDGFTPLHYTINNDSQLNTERLINQGARLDKGDFDGVTPLMYGTEGPIELFKQLLFAVDDGGWDINQQDNDGMTAVNHAVRKGTQEHLKALFYYNADFNLPQHDGLTPLMIAIMDGHMDKAYWLLLNGVVDPNRVDNTGMTALHYACTYQETDARLFMLLINNHACVNVVNHKGQPPICLCDTLQTASFLYEHGAFLNCVYEGDRTYLKDMREEGNVAIVDFLVQNGAL